MELQRFKVGPNPIHWLRFSCTGVGSPNKMESEIMTATPAKMSFENVSSRYLYHFAIIPIRSTYVAELSSNRTGGNGVQVETENKKCTVMYSRSPEDLVWPRTAEKCTKIYNSRPGPLFFSLNLNVS